MLDANKLRGKLVEMGVSVSELSATLNINAATFYRKLKGNSFKIAEADIIVQKLNLSSAEANSIFFSQYIA